MDYNKIKENSIIGLSAAGGVAIAVLLVRQFGDKAPVWAKSLLALAPGLALSLMAKNKYAISGGIGMIGTGILVAAKQFTEGKTGLLATINQNLPGLAGPNDVMQYQQVEDNRLLSGINGLGQMPDNMLLS